MRYTRRYVKVSNAHSTCTTSQEQLLKHIDSRNFVKIDANLLQLAVKFDAGKRRKKVLQSKTPNSRRVQQKMGIMNMTTPMRRKSTSSLKSPTTTCKRNSAVHAIVNGVGGLQGLKSFERKSLATNLKNANMKKVSIQLINAHRSSSTSTSTSSIGFGVTEHHQDLRIENQDQVDEVSMSAEEESQPLTYTFGRYKSSSANTTTTIHSTALVNPHSLTMNINTADADDAVPYQQDAVIEYFDATFKAWAG